MPALIAAAALAPLAATAAEPARTHERPQAHTWRVVNVHDGDTITCLDAENTQHNVRLHGIDAPELGQPFGRVARDRLAQLVKGKAVIVNTHGRDRYGRDLCKVELEHDDVAHRLVAEGLT